MPYGQGGVTPDSRHKMSDRETLAGVLARSIVTRRIEACESHHAHGQFQGLGPNRPTSCGATWVKFSQLRPISLLTLIGVGLRIPTLRIKIMLESNPLTSIMLVRRLAPRLSRPLRTQTPAAPRAGSPWPAGGSGSMAPID